MAVARIKEFRGRGEARFFGTSGANYVSHRAPATVTTQYDITWPAAPPVGNQIMQITAGGVISFIAAGGGTLDDSYDFGGAGAGRIITADAGPLEVAGAGGFLASHSAPVYGLETTGAEYNFRLTAGQSAGIFEIQRGDADNDISNDTFDALFALDGPNRRLGLNTVAPATDVHILGLAAADAKLTIQAVAGQDATLIFNENSTARFEMGYDDSAGGFVLGRVDFTNPVMFVEDTTGDVGFGIQNPASSFHIATASGDTKLTIEAVAGADSFVSFTQAATEIWLLGYSDGNQGLLFSFTPFSTVALFLENATDRIGMGTVSPGAVLEVENSAAAVAVLIDQNANNASLSIDSEATSAPLIDLAPITANARGDIAFGFVRTADPASTTQGDLWHNASSRRFMADLGPFNATLCSVFGPNFGRSISITLSAGVASLASGAGGVITLLAESGTADDVDTITSTTHLTNDTMILRADAGDTITVKHNTGNLHLDGSADKALVNGNQLSLKFNGTDWEQLTPMMVLP